MSKDKARYFGFLVYPDSAPSDWMERLKNTHGMYAISPLHEPEADEKKPHYHVIYLHGGPTTLDYVKRVVIPHDIPANGHIEVCTSPRGSQRYLIHLSDPEKQQWDEGQDAITLLGDFPLDLSRDYTEEDRKEQRRQIFVLIRQNGICEYADLLDGLIDSNHPDLFDYAFNHTIALSKYLDSVRHSRVEPCAE